MRRGSGHRSRVERSSSAVGGGCSRLKGEQDITVLVLYWIGIGVGLEAVAAVVVVIVNCVRTQTTTATNLSDYCRGAPLKSPIL